MCKDEEVVFERNAPLNSGVERFVTIPHIPESYLDVVFVEGSI